MPKYRYDEDKEEVSRPQKKTTSKPRTKRSDHKHEYDKTETESTFVNSNYIIIKKVCKICGRKGQSDWRKKDE